MKNESKFLTLEKYFSQWWRWLWPYWSWHSRRGTQLVGVYRLQGGDWERTCQFGNDQKWLIHTEADGLPGKVSRESKAQGPGLLEISGDREQQEERQTSHSDWEDAIAEVDRESNRGYHGRINVTKERVLSSAKWQRVQTWREIKTMTSCSR